MRIRAATAQDSANVAALAIQVWLHTYATDGVRDALSSYVLREFTEQAVRSDILNSAKRTFVSELDAHLGAFAVLGLDATCPQLDEPAPELEKLYVQEHFVTRGIGSALLSASLADCRARGDAKLWLTVFHGNHRAIRFWEKHGFRSIGETYAVVDDERHKNLILCRSVDG